MASNSIGLHRIARLVVSQLKHCTVRLRSDVPTVIENGLTESARTKLQTGLTSMVDESATKRDREIQVYSSFAATGRSITFAL